MNYIFNWRAITLSLALWSSTLEAKVIIIDRSINSMSVKSYCKKNLSFCKKYNKSFGFSGGQLKVNGGNTIAWLDDEKLLITKSPNKSELLFIKEIVKKNISSITLIRIFDEDIFSTDLFTDLIVTKNKNDPQILKIKGSKRPCMKTIDKKVEKFYIYGLLKKGCFSF